ncbi:phage holin family protein [Deinococcus soli (ex Cha et al. 2016)]|uniref:Integral membrane protein n=2 Tax=Deinococcus soli (ex Cha et al. 2016) TaxID=1309411 RepID=A0ACC6KJA4_9DEIO|nr:phage holin family protein [Deinococcus soli (ex Cha et al. 2016)]MDR6219368.1 putative integral membrane protein [Deinococcus soli (ex Cha et al. 2016)]MDR6327047.1 putative integral membrane protein [Deinococcus soli (ex Cha et al. 2016)]MDR6752487.1 putative integral membrane protein [Deinococcus soli (ex Cha et al. 2016)]
MEERKSMGGALVDVFDAGVTLVKSEITAVARKAGQIAKAKGIGAVLLLAATGPLILGLVFIILAVFYGLMRLGLGAWAAALIIAILSFIVTGALIVMGIKKLGADVQMDEPRHRRDSMDDTEYTPIQPVSPSGSAAPTPTGSNAARDSHNTSGPKVELRRDAQEHAAGENRVLREADGVAVVRTEEGPQSVPVYESKPGGEAANYGSGLNKKLSGHHDHDPNLQEPRVLKDAPGISVSTTPTFREDMQKGGK